MLRMPIPKLFWALRVRFEKLLFDEMRARIKEDDSTVPQKNGDYYYYTRFEEGNQYPIFCRKYFSLDADEEVILDVNELAKRPRLLPRWQFGEQPRP